MENFNVDKKFLTKKHIILIVIVLTLLIVAALLFILYNHSSTIAQATANTSFNSYSGEINLTIPNEYKFSISEKGSYELVLKSDISKSAIYFSKISSANIRDKKKFIEYDKNDYISKFSNISEVSDIEEKIINGLESYNYHFKYRDTMYVDVYWILKDSNFYIIDFNIDTEANNMASSINTIINSLKLN